MKTLTRRIAVVASTVTIIGSVLIGTTASASSGPTLAQYQRLKTRVATLEQRVERVEQGNAGLETLTMWRHTGSGYSEWNQVTGQPAEGSTVEKWDTLDLSPTPWKSGPWTIEPDTVTPVKLLVEK